MPFAFILLLLFLNTTLLGSWEKIIQDKSQPSNLDDKNNKIRTEGIDINFEERVQPLKQEAWVSTLTGSSKEPKKSLSPEISDMLDKIAQLDRMLPDDSIAKHVLFSQFVGAFLHVGDFTKAEQIALRSIRMAERLSGKNSEATLSCRRSIALLYGEIGDYERALEFALSCLEICEQNPKATGKYKANMQTHVASFQVELGQLNQAEDMLKNASTAKQVISQNNDSSDITKFLAVRAALAYARGNYKESIDLLNQGLLDIRKQKINKKHVGSRLEQTLYEGVVDAAYYGLLSELFQALVASNRTSEAHDVLLEYNTARNVDLDPLPASLKSLKNIDAAKWAASKAILEQISGNKSDARFFAMEYLDFQNKNLNSVLLLVESQRLNWQRRYLDFSLPVAFCTPPELANIVLAWKGIVLDSLNAERAKSKVSGNAANKDSLQEITRLRRQLAQMLIQNTEGSEEEIQFLKNKIFPLSERSLKTHWQIKKHPQFLGGRSKRG
jgi:tetratricopeptide (TPR) repeat protein